MRISLSKDPISLIKDKQVIGIPEGKAQECSTWFHIQNPIKYMPPHYRKSSQPHKTLK